MFDLRPIANLLPGRSWLVVAGVVAMLVIAGLIYAAGRSDEGHERDVRDLKTEVRASAGRETSAEQRAVDQTNTAGKLTEWNHAAEQTPDSAPDDRELRRRCRQLRDAGRVLAACERFEGDAQAGAA